MIWNNCQKHESLALELTTVLQNISYSMEGKELVFFVSKLLEKSPAIIVPKELDLMLGMGRKTNNINTTLKETQVRIIEFFWNYLFNADSMSYLDESLATKAISALSEILRLSTIEVIFAYLVRIVENIK